MTDGTDCNECTAIDERSQRLGLPLPHPANDGLVDVMRLREAFDLIDERMVARNDPSDMRIPCTEDLTFYVRVNGNDDNDGLTVATAKATIVGAVVAIRGYDNRGYTITIDVGPGSFEGGRIDSYGSNPTYWVIKGSGAGQTFITSLLNIRVNACECANMSVHSIVSQIQGWTYVNNLDFYANASSNYALHASHFGYIRLAGPISFTGQYASFICARHGGMCDCDIQEMTFGPAASATDGFVSYRAGVINLYTCTFVGKFTGRSHSMYQGGTISGGGNNASLASIPGSNPGTFGGNAVSAIQGCAVAGGFIKGATGELTWPFGLVKSNTRIGVGIQELEFNQDISGYLVQLSRYGAGTVNLVTTRTTGITIATYNTSGVAADANINFTICRV